MKTCKEVAFGVFRCLSAYIKLIMGRISSLAVVLLVLMWPIISLFVDLKRAPT